MMKQIIAILCAALVFAGCNNILSFSDGSHNIKESGVRITVSGDTANPRTLFPSTDFFKYVLSFSGPVSHADITLEKGENSTLVTGLVDGDWTITAKGYVLINGTSKEAAEGSRQIKITSGQIQSVNIPISAKQTGVKGYFSYLISFPPSLVDNAELSIRPYNDWDEEFFDVDNSTPKTIELSPGYYLMSIRLYNDYQTAGLTEIVHIYSNMETKAEYAFKESDFTKFITLSGTINVKVGGQVPQEVYLIAFLDEDYRNYLASTEVNTSYNTWSMRLAAFDTEAPLYFVVVAYDNDLFHKEIGMAVRVKDQDIASIVLATVNFDAFTISGTVNVQVTGAALQEANVVVYAGNGENHNELASVSVNLTDGTWSRRMAPFTNNINLYFGIEVIVNGSWFYKDIDDKSITVKDKDRFIDLGIVQFNLITLSGTINVTYDGGKRLEEVIISAVDQDGYEIGMTSLSLPDVNEPWSIAIEPISTPRYVRFRVEGLGDDWRTIFIKYAGNSPITVTNQSVPGININLGDLPHPDKPVNPVPLVENVWAKGDISESYKVDWYSMDVSAGTSYYLWFNQRFYGDWSQSLDGEFEGWYSDGSQLFYSTSYAWSEPKEFIADSSGRVYIRVRGCFWKSYTGTYELIYSTASNRPVRGVVNYTVTFNSMGGSAVPSRNVASGAQINKPADPVKDGFRFGGWYKQTALTNAWDFATDAVTGKTVLYAKWNPKVPGTIVVTFEGFGDEFIDLTVSTTGSISRSQNQWIEVTVEGADFDNYCQWYIDGSRTYRGWGNNIDIHADSLPIGVHTLSAVVTYNGKPYSKELTFRVVY